MAKTLLVLKTYYSNLMRTDFAHISSSAQTLIDSLATQVDGGSLSLADAQGQLNKLAAGTTSVASLSYSFFTGGVPSAAGFDYLVSPNGPNPNNLNSAYYQSFSAENRYINFAVNLGKSGEALTWFTANYGGLSMADALAKAYTEIFGTAPDAAKINALLNDQVSDGLGGTYSRQQYFASYGGDGVNGLATKAAMIGWLMAEAVKSGIGAYAKANEAFLADLGVDGVAAFRSGLTAAYGTPQAGTAGASLTIAADKSISLNAADAAQKSTNNNDTLTGTNGLNADQSIDVGAGRDKIDLSGTISGKITTADGGDTLVLGSLAATASVRLKGDGNTVTLDGAMARGATLSATGTGNVLHVDAGKNTLVEGTITGFQTVYVHSGSPVGVSGASVIYDVIQAASETPYGFFLENANAQKLVLKDNGNAVMITTPALLGGKTNVDVHLQNFTGAPTTETSGFPGNFKANGGSIGVDVRGSQFLDLNGTLTLHVDSDSTVGLIYGWSTIGVFMDKYDTFPNLKIVGAGKLTAQIASNFTNVDATQAGDLDLAYAMPSTNGGQVFRLGDGTNTLKLAIGPIDPKLVTDPAVSKIYLGGGVDTIKLDPFIQDTQLSNLRLKSDGSINGPTEIIKFQKGVDHMVLDAQIHAVTADVQQYADGKGSLLAALTEVAAHTAANTGAIFTWGGDTYIYSQDGQAGLNMQNGSNAGDGLIKLVGVTSLSVGTGAGAFDIHYG